MELARLEISKNRQYAILKEILFFSICITGLILLSINNYVMFHIIIEVACIITGLSTTIIALNTYKFNQDKNTNFLGISYAFVTCFNFFHVFTFKEINVLDFSGSNFVVQLGLIQYIIESVSLLIMSMQINKKIKAKTMIIGYFIVSMLLYLSVMVWRNFPQAYIDGEGQTTFSLMINATVFIVYVFSILFVIYNSKKRRISEEQYKNSIGILVVKALASLVIIHFVDLYDNNNVVFHILKLTSFYLIYKTVVKTGITNPYEKLAKSEKEYRRLLSLLPEAIFVYLDNKLVYANPFALELAGYEELNDIIGAELGTLLNIHPDYKEKANKRVENLRKNEMQGIVDEKYIFEDGREVLVESLGIPSNDGGNKKVIIVMRDISERRKSEILERKIKEEIKEKEQLIEHDMLKTQFFANISHELKTPLNIILSGLQLIDKTHVETNDCRIYSSFKKYIGMMNQNCYRLLRLINNLIDITKLDAGYLKMNFSDYNIVKLVEDISMSVAEYIKSHDIDLVFDTEIEEKIISCDVEKIERIILNLLSNATKYTPSGGVIEVNIFDEEDNILISIKDTGIGIPDNMIDKIFDRFSQVDSTFTRKCEGSGIGLSIVKALVEAHGGDISVKSEIGVGSEFLVRIPYNRGKNDEYDYNNTLYGSEKKVEKINIEFSDIYNQQKPLNK